MAKMEIELNEEQMEKVEILKSKDIDVGEAIDLLFELQNETKALIVDQQQDADIFEKISDVGFDGKIRAELLKKNYDETQTYDRKVQDAKHKVKWSDLLKF